MPPPAERLLATALAVALLSAAPAAAAVPDAPPTPAVKRILLATTTSTQDSGLLEALLPVFEQETGYAVKTIAVGSGQALALGRRGEADVLLVHSPAEERRLVAEGHGVNRRPVMHNDFVLVGPPADPARIRGEPTTAGAARKIAATRALFVSRGDDSGTHAREKAIWKAAAIDPEGAAWYQQTGLGMGETLNVASEKGGYTLADRGTLLARGRSAPLALAILVEGEPLLLNAYHVIEVNPARWPKVNAAGARAFAAFLVSPRAQQLIGRFGVDRFGAPLFTPDAGKPEAREP
jgi:tungstate transport system substrate-binding protein